MLTLTDGISGPGIAIGAIRTGEDMDGQVERPEMRCACRQKPPILRSLISYLQTGAWQGRSFTLEANEAVWRRAGMRMIFRQDQKRSHYSSSTSLPPSSTDLEMIDFIPALAPGEEAVSDFQGGAGGGDAELRPEMQLGRIQTGNLRNALTNIPSTF